MKIEFLINRLVEKGFQEMPIDGVEINGFFFKKDNRYVVVLKYDSQININEINEEILDIRNYLITAIKEINIWNTYALILFDNQIDFETIHILEKDSTSLRKYVILSESDLNRVFFLDSDDLDITKPIIITKTKSEENILLKTLYKFIKEKDGEIKKLKAQDIIEGINILSSGLQVKHNETIENNNKEL